MKDEYGFNPAPRPISEFPFAVRPTMKPKQVARLDLSLNCDAVHLELKSEEDRKFAHQTIDLFFEKVQIANSLTSKLNIAEANKTVLENT